ncbi:MAG: YibE/F family protein [Lentisphaeria bacterium]|nr:YibE/F family protein [Lentisphaeria bacterium]
MSDFFKKFIPSRRDAVMCFILIAASVILSFIPPYNNEPSPGTKEKAQVISVDNSAVMNMGLLRRGSQLLDVKILSGKYKGQIFRASNELRANMELDKLFAEKDIILVGIMHNADPAADTINAQDYYRINYTVLLFVLFAILLIIFGGYTGFSALLSFVFSCLVIWKTVIPLTLAGYNAIGIAFAAVILLSVVIILLVAGLTRKGIAALAGSILGVLAAALTGWIFTVLFKINGAIMPYAQALLHSGFEHLSLSDIYIGAIFLSSSGAVMDLAMDIASGIEELSLHNKDLRFKELLKSGLRIGRSVVGTMTTTLLLAYSGGYITLMMMFAAQGTSPLDFINNPHVASEVVKTLVGSFGLVLVAPLTALVSALIFGNRKSDSI